MAICIFRLSSYNWCVIKTIQAHYICCALLASICSSCAAAEPLPSSLGSPLTSTQTSVQNPSQENPENWSDRAREVLVNALSLTGIRYKYGGNSPETGFDCSGFVRYVFKQATSLTLPHSALAISQLGKTVTKDELQPGDLVFFNTLKSTFSHVGIYLGNNRFIHSPSSGGQVRVESMQDGYWAKRFNGAQRIDQSKSSKQESDSPQ